MEKFLEKFLKTTLIGLFILVAFFMAFCPPAMAAGNSGVWPVQLVPDGTRTSGEDSGTSIYVIDLTQKNHYTGNIIGQFTGVTVSGVSVPPASATGWPVASTTGISVYYANLLMNPWAGATPQPSGTSLYALVNWTLIASTGGTLRSGCTYYAFDIPFDAAAPYGGLKFVVSGASQIEFGFRYSTSGDPK